eukprot:GHRR01016795.1.p1 GENE.GHRR01016795.1~~GHRR01016795.1.p1  ORF type:complete len:226 (+),score=45.46 GHRR01016795.1:786-1463(+)
MEPSQPKKVAFGAYAEPRQRAEKVRRNTLKIALVASDCLLLGLQPVLVHLSKNKSGKFSFNPISVNLMTEVCKVIFALLVLLCLGTGRPGRPMYRSIRSFIADARHNWLLAVPAGLYAINNYLKFAMQLYFRPTTTKMLSNLKIFTIAILMRTVMQRRFTVFQYEALFLLVAGECAKKCCWQPAQVGATSLLHPSSFRWHAASSFVTVPECWQLGRGSGHCQLAG